MSQLLYLQNTILQLLQYLNQVYGSLFSYLKNENQGIKKFIVFSHVGNLIAVWGNKNGGLNSKQWL